MQQNLLLGRDVSHQNAHVPEIDKFAERVIEPKQAIAPVEKVYALAEHERHEGHSTKPSRLRRQSSSAGSARRYRSKSTSTPRRGGICILTTQKTSSMTETATRISAKEALIYRYALGPCSLKRGSSRYLTRSSAVGSTSPKKSTPASAFFCGRHCLPLPCSLNFRYSEIQKTYLAEIWTLRGLLLRTPSEAGFKRVKLLD